MHSICKLIFAFTIAVIANGKTSDPVSDAVNDPVTEIYEFWKKQDEFFRLGEQKDVVLFLGNTGSGKSATALFVTGAKLNAATATATTAEKPSGESVDSDESAVSVEFEYSGEDADGTGNTDRSPKPEDSVNTEDILITDEHNKIGNETINSHTLIPDLFTDGSVVAYYDCPGFEDTRKPKYELTIAFFLQKLMTYADSFKLVFVVTHSSVKKGEDRNNFITMVQNAVKLIKHIEHYSDAIGLVVTKVQSSSKDLEVIESVAEFLEEVKDSINRKNNEPNVSAEDQIVNSDSVKFIEALLHSKKIKRSNRRFYPKIGIFRRPEKVESLDKIPTLAKERLNLKAMINDRLKYVRKENNDFGFVISPKSKDYIKDLTEKIIEDGFGSDMANVNREVKEFYHKNEIHTSDVSELYQKSKQGHELFSAIEAKDPRVFLKEILDATYVLEMAMSNNTIEPILKHIEAVDFLVDVVDQILNHQLIHKVNDIVSYLKNSENWYGFLMFLKDELTNIGFQNENMKNVARNIIGNLKRFENAGNDVLIRIDEIGLNPLLEKFVNSEIPYLGSITSIDASNIKALKNVLNEFSSDKLDISDCTSNPHDMEVKGHVIKMSDVTKDKCFSTAKKIKIFALNKLIVDDSVNKTGEQAQIVIIAPTWDIIGQISFILDGANGMNHPSAFASNGTGSQWHPDNGEKGEPGKPGSAGGNFFAIGSKFINGDHLTIQVNGGNGGAGQHGGNGTLRIEGRTAPVPSETCPHELERLWKEQGFTHERLDVSFNRVAYEYEVQGVDGTKAGDGGDGGKQGDPGLAGKIVIFELGQAAMLKTYMINGATGAIGKGGLGGGRETENGKTLRVSSADPNVVRRPGMVTFDRNPCTSSIDKTIDNGKHAAGRDGNDNANTLNWVSADPPLEFDHPLYAVNEYKSFARKHSVGSTRQTEMNTFISKMTDKETLKAQYGALDLIDEFITMENQYFQMRGKIDFIPPLESLLTRTQELATANKGKPEFAEQKRALAYLYTAILSKINGINSKVFKNTVYDLDGFLQQVNGNINDLQESIAQNNMNIVRNDFNSQLNEKVRSANQFIDTQITPVIKGIFEEVDSQIEKLIEASIGKQNGVLSSIEAQNEARKKLEANLRLRWILAPIKVVAAAANAFGPFGMAVGTTLNTGTNVIESLAMNDVSVNINVASTLSTAFKTSMTTVGDVLRKKPELLQQKIVDIDKYIKKNLPDPNATTEPAPKPVYDDEIQKLKAEVTRSKGEIEDLNKQLTERIKDGDFNIPKDLLKQCDEVEKRLESASKETKDKLEERKKQLSIDKKEEIAKFEKPLNIIKHVQSVVSIVDVSIQTYNQIRTDETKVNAVSAAIAGLKSDLGVLRDHERKIHSALIPEINKLQSNINEMSKNLEGNSHVELDVKKWNIRRTLSDVRLLFNKMTKDFSSVRDSLGMSIDNLDEGLATLINVYDRIDSYSDTAKLTAYIKNIVAHDSLEISNPELADDVAKLKQMIQSNIVLEEYELAMHAFKQHYFPIADSFMTQFELPESLQMTDTNAIIRNAMGQVKKLMNKIALSKTLDTEYDNSLHTMAKFDGEIRSQSPFFTWKYHEYKDQIKDLLQGKAITIKSDVTRGVNQNAVKFNKIGIRFKLPDVASQSELDNILYDHFKVSMSMTGTNYYRCNNRYYQIPLDHNVNLKLWFEKDLLNPSNDPDTTYLKINSNSAFLSPYSMWTIKLIDGDYQKLKPFVDDALDMELIGTGQYLEYGKFSNGVCNNQLDNYYIFDETISNVNTLMQSKGL